ncbi:hypothetical protein BOW53_13580 [Solemya pervernicosa gill symbiont]|uniref:Transglycosylase SLT domain-containing protein n=2 Tax=Gammaproteobacteria incertae sedis TaxID=118884 RepID=A0A1T2L1K2_9GAMM|nr:hypothetical protein BOW53_13580 [Solemya pervernicosa gill symbiont]
MILPSTLWASKSVDPSVDSSVWSSEYDEYFKKYAARYFGPSFDWRWFKAQAIAESGLNYKATSSSGARGLMQLIPSTYQDIRRDQSHFGELETPVWNVAAGIFYDRQIYRKWRDRPEQERLYLTFASYNAGYGRVLKALKRVKGDVKGWDQIKQYLPRETRAYVERIRRLMKNEPRPIRLVQLTGYLPVFD